MTQRQPNDSHLNPALEAELLNLSVPIVSTPEAKPLIFDESPSSMYLGATVKATALSWLTLLNRDEAEVTIEPIDDTFVDNVVKIFKGQRIRGYQFAVLILSPHYQVTIKQSPSCTMTDNTSPTHPPNSTLRDYIVGRPEKSKQHAEKLLLERFDELLARNEFSCQSIVLYTWFVPCDDCTGKIINKLGQFTETHHVTVVYLKKMRKTSEEQEKRNTNRLEAAGINVIKRKGFLQPAIKPRGIVLPHGFLTSHL